MSTLQERLRTIASRGRMDDADVQEVFEAADALDAAEAKLAAIDALHRKHTINCLPMDCYNGNCDHEDDCPEVDIDVCEHCMSHTEVVTDEWFPASVEWPCPTHRILHPEGGDQ